MKPRDLQSVTDRRQEKVDFAAKVGAHLKKVRLGSHISQEKLSQDAGYYRTYVNKIERGKYSPSLHTIWRLVHTLGISLSKFFKNFTWISALSSALFQKT